MRTCVLIVHDDFSVRGCLGEFLTEKGYRVLAASNGREALGVLEEDVPVLLVIGIGMPLMSGWKLIEALAHYPDLARIPRLLVSAGERPDATCARALAILRERADEGEGEANAISTSPVPRRSTASA